MTKIKPILLEYFNKSKKTSIEIDYRDFPKIFNIKTTKFNKLRNMIICTLNEINDDNLLKSNNLGDKNSYIYLLDIDTKNDKFIIRRYSLSNKKLRNRLYKKLLNVKILNNMICESADGDLFFAAISYNESNKRFRLYKKNGKYNIIDMTDYSKYQK